MFEKILIANRGEIAVRIIKTCRKMGIRSVALFSEIDARSLHVRQADESAYLGPSPSEASYLDMKNIINIAREYQCQAIHPGYGFLSENPQFAEMATSAGLVFIGPPAPVIETLGDKIASKNLASKVGIDVVPAHALPVVNLEEARDIAWELGYPVLLKPAAGGGGKGMRVVNEQRELPSALASSQSETKKAFGDDKIFIERYIINPRHVEIQIIGDHYGHVIHLGERECSIQRRYQKIIEEAPSPIVDASLRDKMGEMACDLAREAGYSNAGTVEFILDPEGNFYFLEMNTRLQVEHPVTEMVTSLDLVELQIKISAGEPLAIQQKDVTINGWALEARICAEDPEHQFFPSTGIITRYAEPHGENIRLDSGIEAGSFVSVFYDSLLAKLITYGKSRNTAIYKLIHALNRYHIEGVTTNIDFCNAIVNHPVFIKGEISTGFIDKHFMEGRTTLEPPFEKLHYMIMAATLVYHNRQTLVRDSLKPMAARVGQVHEQDVWHHYIVKGNEDIFNVSLLKDTTPQEWIIKIDDIQYKVKTPEFEFYRRRIKLDIDGLTQYFRLQYRENFIWAAFSGVTCSFEIYSPKEWELSDFMPRSKEAEDTNALFSPMPGLVLEIKVKEGDQVFRGQDLVVIESMKMQSGVSSPCDGEVEKIMIPAGNAVETGDILITFKS